LPAAKDGAEGSNKAATMKQRLRRMSVSRLGGKSGMA
jgi:hypothetical protein